MLIDNTPEKNFIRESISYPNNDAITKDEEMEIEKRFIDHCHSTKMMYDRDRV